MNKQTFALFAALLICLVGCATHPIVGPGMTVTFNSVSKGKSISITHAVSASGAQFPDPGGLSPDNRPIMNGKIMASGGKTMGAAPDGRELPEWVEFSWKETPYPYPEPPSAPEAYAAWSEGIRKRYQLLPFKTERVTVRERVPQSVINELMEANRQTKSGKLPEKMLWIYFVWTDSGIKFRWELHERDHETKQMGGDEIAQ